MGQCMKIKVGSIAFFTWLGLIVITSSCKRAVDWASENFNQGTSVTIPVDTVRPYIKTVAIHNYFSTAAIFDAIWLSDEVRRSYVEVTTNRLGKSTEQSQLLLRRQLEENRHYITFYVLSEYNIPLADMSDWHLFLKIDQHIYQPCEIKAIDLSPEYRAFFGSRWSRLKNAYVVRFDAKTVDEQPLLLPSTQEMSLWFNATKKQTALTWIVAGRCDQEGVY